MKKLVFAIVLGVGFSTATAADLIEVYQLAQQKDAQIRAALALRDAAKEAKPLARAQLLPNINLTASADQTDRDLKDSSGDDDSFSSTSVALSATQPLYRRDRWLKLEQSDQVLEQADADYLAAEQDLMIRTATAYFNVLSQQDILEFTQSETKAIERQLDQAKQRFDVGLIAITGVHEAQARYDQSRANEIKAVNELYDAWEALRRIIVEKPETLARVIEDMPLQMPQPADIEEWTATALKNNPEIQSAKYQQEIARKEIEVQRSGHYPTLDLRGSYAMDRTDNDFGSDADTSNIGVQLEVPLYSGGGVTAATRQARSNYTAALEGLDQQRRAIENLLRNAYRKVESDISRVKALKATTVSAQSALDATTAGFDVGTRTLVDVLDGQRDLFRAKSDYTRSRYEYILAGLVLKQAAGTLTADDLALVNSLLD